MAESRRILHIADLHFDQFEKLGGRLATDGHGLNLGVIDTNKAIDSLLESCQPLDGVVVAGDLGDRTQLSPWETKACQDAMAIAAESCRAGSVLVIAGNHETPKGAEEPDALVVLDRSPDVMMIHSARHVSYAGIQFACLPYPRTSRLRDLGITTDKAVERSLAEDAMKAWSLQMRSEGAQILVHHGTVGGAVSGAQPRPIEGDLRLHDEVLEAYPGIMLGHIHKRQNWHGCETAWYAGGPRIMDFGEINDGNKGGILWTIEPGGAVHADLVDAESPREWIDVEWDDPADTESALADIAADGAIYRLRARLPGEVLDQVRTRIKDLISRGAFIIDNLRLQQEERIRDASVAEEGLGDDEILRHALDAREIPETEVLGCLALHAEVLEEGARK